MSDAVKIALIVALPPTIAALGALLAIILADRRAGKKLDHITVLTNSTLTAAKEQIRSLKERVARLTAELGGA